MSSDKDCNLNGTFDVGVEALYWKPTTGGFDYVEGGDGVVHVHPLSLDYHWGVRLGGRYLSQTQCHYFSASGLYYYADDSARTTGRNLQVAFSQGIPSFDDVLGRLDFDYWNVDLKSGHYLHWEGGIAFHIFAGFRYVDLVERQKIRAHESDGLATFHQKLEFWGLGPQLGVGGMSTLFDCLRIFGELGVAALIGEQRTHFVTHQGGQTIDQRFGSTTVIVPALESSLGLATGFPIGCVAWNFAVGYELHTYLDLFKVIPAFSFATARLSRNVGFAGPYLSLVAGF